jgi:catechol 2,3-dioxygenase-like lactoylglutathione lyase family enzyme
MFSHMVVGSNDLERAKRFYDALFLAIGGPQGVLTAETGRLGYRHKAAAFLVKRPVNGAPASVGNGVTVGFAMDSPEQADAWHAAGVASGGASCEDPPGLRVMPDGRRLYLAYLRDPDGNKLCALHHFSD